MATPLRSAAQGPRRRLLPLAVLLALGWAGPRALPAQEPKAEPTVHGTVVDRQAGPVAGARVRAAALADNRKPAEATIGPDGTFQIDAALPGFLFVEKAGFRFHGQRCDKPGAVRVTLTRRTEEPAGKPLATLPPALPRAERKALAAKLLGPQLKAALAKEDENARLRPLAALAGADPARALEELEKKPLKSAWFDGYVRRAAAKSLLHESVEEARGVVDSVKDPGFRSMGYLDLHDALPAGKRAERLALLNQALLHSKGIEGNDHRVIQLAWVAKRLWELGEKERATALLREGEKIAKELPTAAWAGYARGAFAEDLALIDLPSALALLKDLKDPFEFVRHHGNLAQRLAPANPAEAERVFGLLSRKEGAQQVQYRDQYALRLCHRMAPADLPRARKLAGTIKDVHHRARAFGLMAQALAKSNPKEALKLLDESFDLLAAHVASGQDHFNGMYNAASLAALMLPAAEQIDPALVPEFLWRAASLRGNPVPKGAEGHTGFAADAAGTLALALARYDRGLALALVEEAERVRGKGEAVQGTHYLAAALADPRRAVALLEKLTPGQSRDRVRGSVINLLLAEGEDVWREVHRTLGQWHLDSDDL